MLEYDTWHDRQAISATSSKSATSLSVWQQGWVSLRQILPVYSACRVTPLTRYLNMLIENKEIDNCIDWLSRQGTTKNVNPRHTSYGYKHMVENWCGEYVSNESFIEAARLTGFTVKMLPNSPNAMVNISERTIRQLHHKRTKSGLLSIRRDGSTY